MFGASRGEAAEGSAGRSVSARRTSSAAPRVSAFSSPPADWSSSQRLFLFGAPADGSSLVDGSSSSGGRSGRGRASGKAAAAARHSPVPRSSTSSSSSYSLLCASSSTATASRKRPRSATASSAHSSAARLCELRGAIHELDVESRKIAAARRALLLDYQHMHAHGSTDAPRPTLAQAHAQVQCEAQSSAMGAESSARLVACPPRLSEAAAASTQARALSFVSTTCVSAATSRCGCVRHRLRAAQHCTASPLSTAATAATPAAEGAVELQEPVPLVASRSEPCWPPSPAAVCLPALPCGCLSLWRMSSAAPLPALPFVPFLSALFLHNKYLPAAASGSIERSSVACDNEPLLTDSSAPVAAASSLAQHSSSLPSAPLSSDNCSLGAVTTPLWRAASLPPATPLLGSSSLPVAARPPTLASCTVSSALEASIDVIVLDDIGCDRPSQQRATAAARGSDVCSVQPVHRAVSLSALAAHKAASMATSPIASTHLIHRTASLPSAAKPALLQTSSIASRPPLSPLSHAALNRRQAIQPSSAPPTAVATATPQPAPRQRQEEALCSSHVNPPVAAAATVVDRPARADSQLRNPKQYAQNGSTQHQSASTSALSSGFTRLRTACDASTAPESTSSHAPSMHSSASAAAGSASSSQSRNPPTPPPPLLTANATAASLSVAPSAVSHPAAVPAAASPAASSSHSPAAPASVRPIPLSSAQSALSFSALRASFSSLFGVHSVPLFSSCSVADLQRWMGELGLKHKSRAQMAAKLTHIYQQCNHAAATATAAATLNSPLAQAHSSSTAGPDDSSDSPTAALSVALTGRLRAFIRHHSSLYLRVLLLQTVDLHSLHLCCTGAGLEVSREQLVSFLDQEGVAFAQTPTLRHGNRSRQKRHRT